MRKPLLILLLRQRPLSFGPHALIGMCEQLREFVVRALTESFAQQALHLRDLRGLRGLCGGMREFVNASAFRALPAFAPFAEIQIRVGTELDVRGLRIAEKCLGSF